jgi:phosphoribosylamine-glycine ligase
MDRMENDRRFFYQLMRQAGIKQPLSWFFTDWDAAYEFLDGRGKAMRLVFKPCGEHSGNVPSYVSSDAEDLRAMLKWYRRELGDECDFMLQEFVEGLEISTELWLSRGKPIWPMIHNFETKAMMEGNRGKSGGCTGAMCWPTQSDRVIESSVTPLLPWLEKAEYTGLLDISTITTPADVFVLECCPRPGYDTTPTWVQESFDGDLAELFAAMASGKAEPLPAKEGFAGGVRLTVAPWPSIQFACPGDVPVRGIPDFEHFYPYDIRRNKEGDIFTVPAFGMVGIATGSGSTLAEAMEAAYKVADAAKVPEVQYRHDLGELFQSQYDELQELLKA